MILSQCVALVESSNDPAAMRFENDLNLYTPGWITSTLTKIAAMNPIDKDVATARMIGVTSWGLFQLLGANIYDRGYDKPIAAFLNSPADQTEIFGRFVQTKGFDADEDLTTWPHLRFENFATFYNGPGAVPNYVLSMMEAMSKG